MTRKQARAVLDGLDVDNPFTLKTATFMGVSRGPAQVLTVKDWEPSPKADEICDALRGTGTIVTFKPKAGGVF